MYKLMSLKLDSTVYTRAANLSSDISSPVLTSNREHDREPVKRRIQPLLTMLQNEGDNQILK